MTGDSYTTDVSECFSRLFVVFDGKAMRPSVYCSLDCNSWVWFVTENSGTINSGYECRSERALACESVVANVSIAASTVNSRTTGVSGSLATHSSGEDTVAFAGTVGSSALTVGSAASTFNSTWNICAGKSLIEGCMTGSRCSASRSGRNGRTLVAGDTELSAAGTSGCRGFSWKHYGKRIGSSYIGEDDCGDEFLA